MFTGIVEEIGTLQSRQAKTMSFFADRVLEGLEIGGSMAVNGVCLTVTGFDSKGFRADVMPETLGRTNLGGLKSGDPVNLEKPLTLDRPLGGHFVQGHVDGTGTVKALHRVEGATVIGITAPAWLMRYIVEKGFIAVDGISLTVVEKGRDAFKVSIVGHSLQNTTLGTITQGAAVNLEVDILAKYVESLLYRDGQTITPEYLRRHGFV